MSQKMWQLCTVGVLALILTANSAVNELTECLKDAPENCTFSGIQCRWNQNNEWLHRNHKNVDAAALDIYRQSGNLTSRTACSTQGNVHCFTFSYYFTRNYTIELSVWLKEKTETKKVLLWNRNSSSDDWNRARVPIQTSSNFSIIIESQKITINEDSVYLASFNYQKTPCSAYPSGAGQASRFTMMRPTYSASSSRQTTQFPSFSLSILSSSTPLSIASSSKSSAAAAVMPTTRITTVTTTTKRTFRTANTTRSTTHVNVTTNDRLWTEIPDYNNRQSEMSEHNVGLIVGVTMAGLIILGTILVLLIVFKRRYPYFGTMCFNGGRQQKELTAQLPSKQNDQPSTRKPGDSDADYTEIDDTHPSYDNSQLEHSFDLSLCSSVYPYGIKAWTNASTSQLADLENDCNKLKQNKKADQSKHNTDSTSCSPLPSNYSLASPMEDEAAGVYHYLEDDVVNQEQVPSSAVYHILEEDLVLNDKENAANPGMYHTPGDDPTMNTSGQPVCHTSKGGIKGNKRQQHGQPMITSRENEDAYNSLDFTGKDTDGVTTDTYSDAVYNHLSETAAGVYNEVDREKRAEVIDSEYAHIK